MDARPTARRLGAAVAAALAAVLAAAALDACADERATAPAPPRAARDAAEPAADAPPGVDGETTELPAAGPGPAASVTVPVEVPAAMRQWPFDVPRTLRVPPGYAIAVYARVSGARFMARTPNGDLLVSNPGQGRVYLVRPGTAGADPQVTIWASGLYRPHDIVLGTLAGQIWVYVAEGDKIARYRYTIGDATGQGREVVVADLPSESTPELQGAYGHELKNIAFYGDRLYVSIASTCNACRSDTESSPVRGAVYVYPSSGGPGRLFARGIRNAEGLAIVPGTSTLWAVVNNRDNVAYPFHQDYDGDGLDDYGKVMRAYVDDHPPEAFVRVRDGADFGWPFCNPNPDTPSGLDDMPFDRDVQRNASGARLDCAAATRVDKGIQAHSAPLGLSFLQSSNVAAAYRTGAAVAYHGSWNRGRKTGYKVVHFPWTSAGRPGAQTNFVTGWATSSSRWGRPVDVAVDADGDLFVSDDYSGTVYRLYSTAARSAARVTGLTLINADTDQPVPGYDPIPEGATLDLSALPTRNLNLIARTSPSRVGSVRFSYDNTRSRRLESVAPYSMIGESGGAGQYVAWTPRPGKHLVYAMPWSGSRATGSQGTPASVTFTVVDP